jgi:hypothetical protein
MGGFAKSAEFHRGVEILADMARVECLQCGYAIFAPDLSTARWVEDEDAAVMGSKIYEPYARVPTEDDNLAELHTSLVAALSRQIEAVTHMLPHLPADSRDEWEGFRATAEQHLFGGEAPEGEGEFEAIRDGGEGAKG